MIKIHRKMSRELEDDYTEKRKLLKEKINGKFRQEDI